MSRLNGEKARAALERRARTARRVKDRARRAEIQAALAPKPAAKRPAKRAAKKPDA